MKVKPIEMAVELTVGIKIHLRITEAALISYATEAGWSDLDSQVQEVEEVRHVSLSDLT